DADVQDAVPEEVDAPGPATPPRELEPREHAGRPPRRDDPEEGLDEGPGPLPLLLGLGEELLPESDVLAEACAELLRGRRVRGALDEAQDAREAPEEADARPLGLAPAAGARRRCSTKWGGGERRVGSARGTTPAVPSVRYAPPPCWPRRASANRTAPASSSRT